MTSTTERIAALLTAFNAPSLGGRRVVEIQSNTYHGGPWRLDPALLPFSNEVPLFVLKLITERNGLFVTPFVFENRGLWIASALPLVFASWRPRTQRVDIGTAQSRDIVLAEEKRSITAALESMPPPTLLVDAGPDVWAGWALTEPMVDLVAAHQLLNRLSVALKAVPVSENARDVLLPFAGIVRNWNVGREQVDIVSVDPSRRYSLSEINTAIKRKDRKTTHA
jgi:hypothetical protein